MASVGMWIEWEGDEQSRRRFLWGLVNNGGFNADFSIYDEDSEDKLHEYQSFDTMDSLVSYAQARAEDGHFDPGFPYLGEFCVVEIRDGLVSVEAETEDFYQVLMEIADSTSFEGLTVTLGIDGAEYCGMEHFKFVDGMITEQWFENDRTDRGVWVTCRINWKGPNKKARALLKDITAQDKIWDFFLREEFLDISAGVSALSWDNLVQHKKQRWWGRRLNLDSYYNETGPSMRCAICDGEIASGGVSFDAYNPFTEREKIVHMFDAIAAAHPALEFDMGFTCLNDCQEIEGTRFFTYKNGARAAAERACTGGQDALGFVSTGKRYYRFSKPLDDEAGKAAALAFAQKDPENFWRVPEKFRTREVCLEEIKERGAGCGLVPRDIQSEEFFLEAVQINKNGKALKYIPVEYLTQTVCAAALEHHPGTLDAGELGEIGKKLNNAGKKDTAMFMFNKAIEAGSAVSGLEKRLFSFEKTDSCSGTSPVTVTAKIAREEHEASTGLMYRQNLPDGEGMLFVFEEDEILSFWMEHTFIPLSIAFIASDGRIIDIRDMEPHNLNPVESARPVRYALEVPRGWFTRKGIHEGDRIILGELGKT